MPRLPKSLVVTILPHLHNLAASGFCRVKFTRFSDSVVTAGLVLCMEATGASHQGRRVPAGFVLPVQRGSLLLRPLREHRDDIPALYGRPRARCFAGA